MKITAVKHFAVKVGFRCRFIVKIETDAGIHGLGEAGTAGAGAAIMNAINDALTPFDARVVAQPYTPDQILRALGKIAG